MAKRGYKLQEFVAHSGNVNCLRFGKKTCRLFLTGGDDQNVNLWSIGKPTPAASLSGHTSPVESVAFNSAEVQVLAGASSGVIKLWDLEETKMVRTLTGHRSYCTACEFHPFGEFFASGSMDTNLKLWDIRKKGSIHTYKGHTRGISNIRFTPDGRWVVSGGFDNVVKVWDLTAGKLLHDFKFHEGHIRSMDFHPLEFLLATGSADRTVKFWDLETFEMIGSARREAAGVRSITFHPDGRSLFCGLDDCLKVYSWEPVICHDSVEMGWSTLSDLCIHDGKLLGGAYYQNSVGVWVADISLIEPYGAGLTPERKSNLEQKQEHVACHLGRVGSNRSSDSSLRCTSPDIESDEIKNIYVDCENPVIIKKVTSRSPKVVPPSDSKEINTQSSLKPNFVIGVPAKTNGLSVDKSFAVPSVVPRDIPDGKNLDPSRRESISATRASAGMPQKTFHTRRLSNNKVDMEKISVVLESGSADNLAGAVDCKELNIDSRLMTDNNAKDSSQGNDSIVKYDGEKLEKTSAQAPQNNQENCNGALECGKGLKAVRVVNGVAVVRGRTRSLVERFEKREGLNMDDVHKPDTVSHSKAEEAEISPLPPSCCKDEEPETSPLPPSCCKDEEPETSPFTASHVLAKEATCPLPPAHSEVEEAKVCTSPDSSPDSYSVAEELEASPMPATQFKVEEVRALRLPASRPKPEPLKASPVPASQLKSEYARKSRLPASRSKPEVLEVSPMPGSQFKAEAKTSRLSAFRSKSEEAKISRLLASRSKLEEAHKYRVLSYSSKVEEAQTASLPNTDQQTVARVKSAQNDDNVIEDLMQSHDVLLSAFRSRLTKLQVVRHFWEQNDVKGAINALRKLPDCAVQADVVSVLLERMEIINLDLFSCLLPVVLSLLDSKVERHANVSLEMLIKLIAVFGPVVRSAVSARPSVGVDLHAEERILCCRQCLVHLQNIQKILPALTRRGGLLAKGALQLNLLLQES